MQTFLHHSVLTRRGFIAGLAVSCLSPVPNTAVALADSSVVIDGDLARYQVGDLDVVVFNTDHRQVSSVMGAANASVEEREAACEEYGPLLVDTAVTLVDTGAQIALIDSGSSSFLARKLERVGYAPEEIDVVVSSHLHADHAGGAFNALDRKPLFPNARYVVSRAEYDFWMRDDIEGVSSYALPFIPTFRTEARMIIADAGTQLELVEWEDEIFPGMRMLPATGHTGGHSAVEITSRNVTLLHIGDLIVHPALHLAHPDWYLIASAWPEEDIASRRVLMDRAADEHMIVQTVHFPFPGVGYVEKDGDAWKWLPLNGSATTVGTP